MIKKILNLFQLDITGKRIFGLDFLRSIAILLVMIGHSPKTEQIGQFINPILVDGVAIFFVLSGFLIGNIMLKSFDKELTLTNITNFWKRRWLRTLPNYYFILFILIIIELSTNNWGGYEKYIKYPFFLQNFYYPIGNFFPESWSLTIEEWFYTITPLLLLLIFYITKNRLTFKYQFLSVIIFIIISAFLYRVYKYFNLDVKNYITFDRFFLRQLLSRIDAIMFGVLGAWIKYYYSNIFYKGKKYLFLIGIFSLVTIHIFEGKNDLFLYILSFSFTSTSVLLMLPLMDSWKSTSLPIKNIITYCSLISYSMYLTNLSLVSGILNLFSVNIYVKGLLFWGITIILSLVLYKYLEVPIMKFRDKITHNK